MRGEDVLQQLRAEERTRHVPVVMVTADATPRQIDRLLDAGARAYLTKPLDVEGFLALLDDVLRAAGPVAGPAPPHPLRGTGERSGRPRTV
jgi:CheY-like chemotaxis protein